MINRKYVIFMINRKWEEIKPPWVWYERSFFIQYLRLISSTSRNSPP